MTSKRWRLLVRILPAVVAFLVAACGETGENLAIEEGPGVLLADAVGMTSVRLRWPRADLSGGVRSYRIERRGEIGGSFNELVVIPAPAGDTVIYFDTSVEPDHIYGYRVSALGNAGASSSVTVIAGVHTPPQPGIDVEIVTLAPTSAAADPNGYVARISGPTSASGAVGIGAATSPFVRRFSPLEAGQYTVTLSGVAGNCRVPNLNDPSAFGDTVRQVMVTDLGVQTVSKVRFTVDCRDPERGTIEANIAVSGGIVGNQPFEVIASGLADDASLPDNERAYVQSRSTGQGLVTFDNLRPGSYDVELRNIQSGCTLDGAAKRSAAVAALSIQRIEYTVDCSGSGGGDVDDPAKPFKLRSQWSNATPEPGSTVALDVSLFLGNNPSFVVSGVDVLTAFNSTVLRYDGMVAPSGVTVTVNSSTPGVLAWGAVVQNAPASGPVALVRFNFTVIGQPGSKAKTATTVTALADQNGDESNAGGSYVSQTQAFPEASLTVAGGAQGGSGNQSPLATIAGSNPLTTLAGTALSVSGAGSSDPDGTITSYAWNFPGGAPSTGTGAQSSTTYTGAGNYDISLTVTDNNGATAVTTRSVTVSGSGGTNLAPTAIIAGPNPITATAGSPVTFAATGSSDPEGGPLTYAWSFPGGSPASATGPSASITYATAGAYAATLTVTDDHGLSANTSRAISVATPSFPLTWRNSFGTAQAGRVAMTITLDLRSDLPETPGPEQLQSFRADSIKWDPTVLEYESTEFASNMNGTATFNPLQSGRLRLQASAVGDGPGGLLTLATVYFTVKPGSPGTTVTTTKLGSVVGTSATGSFDYWSRVILAEATYPPPGP